MVLVLSLALVVVVVVLLLLLLLLRMILQTPWQAQCFLASCQRER